MPVRLDVGFTVAVANLEEASDRMDRLVEMAEHMGLCFEGGEVDVMDRQRVIADSPVDRALRGEVTAIGQCACKPGNPCLGHWMRVRDRSVYPSQVPYPENFSLLRLRRQMAEERSVR